VRVTIKTIVLLMGLLLLFLCLQWENEGDKTTIPRVLRGMLKRAKKMPRDEPGAGLIA